MIRSSTNKILLLAAAAILHALSLHAQDFVPDERHQALSSRAMASYQQQKYQDAALTYDSLFTYSKGEGVMAEYLIAAFSYARVDSNDKAFTFLRKALASYGIVSIDDFVADEDLKRLHIDKRWPKLIDEVNARNKELEAKLNKPVKAMLDSIYTVDQADRLSLDSLQNKYGMMSTEAQTLWRKIMKQDTSNLVAVKHVLNTYGWLGPEEVGEQGATTLFLVIQHSDSITQKNYLPMMRRAVKDGKAKASHLALLEDRVLTTRGKEQIYGSQFWTDNSGRNSFYPIMDETNVNKRRASMGLGPLEDYAKQFGIEYHVPRKK